MLIHADCQKLVYLYVSSIFICTRVFLVYLSCILKKFQLRSQVRQCRNIYYDSLELPQIGCIINSLKATVSPAENTDSIAGNFTLVL